MMKTEEKDEDATYLIPAHRYLIYCWECNGVAVMPQGVAPDEFLVHAGHRTQMIKLSMYDEQSE